MAYDSPKAAHFVAYGVDGNALAWCDHLGLECRWLAAEECRRLGVRDMRHPDEALIATALRTVNDYLDGKATVKLRTSPAEDDKDA